MTFTLVLFQPARLAAGDNPAEIVGTVMSIFTVPDAVAGLPALSTAVPE